MNVQEEREEIVDEGVDILSHRARRNRIHVLTADPVLATDVCERIRGDKRLKNCKLVRPAPGPFRETVREIERMAPDTVGSRLLIMDVRRLTMFKLRRAFNAIVGYNRKNFNKECFTVLIGDGPVNLFQMGKALEMFIPHLSSHRVDYHPAVFFYDPFLHYEPDEVQLQSIDEDFVLPQRIPHRLIPLIQQSEDMQVATVRRFFRATGKSESVRQQRLRTLRRLYKKRIKKQFPNHADGLRDLLSRKGIRLATEWLHMYPLYFEDWVHELMQKARRNALERKPPSTA